MLFTTNASQTAQTGTARDGTGTTGRGYPDNERPILIIAAIILCGLCAVMVYPLFTAPATSYASRVCTGLMVAGAMLALGALGGFLFGIPRTLQQTNGTQTSVPAAGSGNDDRGSEYAPNTNLEQISDWLTKIIVGVGLTKLTVMPDRLFSLAGRLAPGLGDAPTAPWFAAGLIVFFTTTGFISGYLWTRLFLPGAFRRADRELEELELRMNTLIDHQNQKDAAAKSLVARQIDARNGTPPVGEAELREALEQASDPVLVDAFYAARHARRKGIINGNPEQIARTIPVFHALIERDRDRKYHRNHAQLAYALKDKAAPELVEAETALNEAISRRNSFGTNGWEIYELNRALCRIMLDEKTPPANPAEREKEILADLRVAAKSDLMSRLAATDAIDRWLKTRGLTIDDLRT